MRQKHAVTNGVKLKLQQSAPLRAPIPCRIDSVEVGDFAAAVKGHSLPYIWRRTWKRNL